MNSTTATVAEWADLTPFERERQDAENARELEELLQQSRRENATTQRGADTPEFTLSELLGEPQQVDLWPGHAYLPPKILQLETIIPLSNAMLEDYNAGRLIPSLLKACEIIAMVGLRSDGQGGWEHFDVDYAKAKLDEAEAPAIVGAILAKQGLVTEEKGGALSPWHGAKTFVLYAATTPDIPSADVES